MNRSTFFASCAGLIAGMLFRNKKVVEPELTLKAKSETYTLTPGYMEPKGRQFISYEEIPVDVVEPLTDKNGDKYYLLLVNNDMKLIYERNGWL